MQRTERTGSLKRICFRTSTRARDRDAERSASRSLVRAGPLRETAHESPLGGVPEEAVGVGRPAVSGGRVVGEHISIERECRNGSFFQEPKASVAEFGGGHDDAPARLRVAPPRGASPLPGRSLRASCHAGYVPGSRSEPWSWWPRMVFPSAFSRTRHRPGDCAHGLGAVLDVGADTGNAGRWTRSATAGPVAAGRAGGAQPITREEAERRRPREARRFLVTVSFLSQRSRPSYLARKGRRPCTAVKLST